MKDDKIAIALTIAIFLTAMAIFVCVIGSLVAYGLTFLWVMFGTMIGGSYG